MLTRLRSRIASRRRPLVLATLALTLAQAAFADLDSAIGDLTKALGGVAEKLETINRKVSQTADRLEMVYPESTKDALAPLFAPVRSLTQEAQSLSNQWRFEGDTDAIWRGVFGGGPRVAKESWQAVFGAPPPSYRADIDELMDATAVLGVNVVASRMEATTPQHKFWDGLYALTRNGYKDQSAGLAERHMALGMAGVGRVLVEQGETLSSELALASLRFQENRYRKRLQETAGLKAYSDLATLGGGR